MHRLTQAGNATLAAQQQFGTLCGHAAGNYHVRLTMAAELLEAAVAREQTTLDEKLYLEVFAPPTVRRTPAPAARR